MDIITINPATLEKNQKQNKKYTDYIMKNTLIPQMRGKNQVVKIADGLYTQMPNPEVIKNMYGYNLGGKQCKTN